MKLEKVIIPAIIIFLLLLATHVHNEYATRNDYFIGVDDCFFRSAGQKMEIVNNELAIDVNYSELLEFIEKDETNEIPYTKDVFICGQFAEVVQNNAEKNGIRAGIVIITYDDGSDSHAINVFKTTDSGYVFIDCCSGSDLIVKEPKVGVEEYYTNFSENTIETKLIEQIYLFW